MNFLALLLILTEVKFHQVSVTRSQTDVYSFKGGFGNTAVKGILVTNRCYKYAYNEPAVIRFEKGSRDNKVLFKDGTVCEIKSVAFE